MSTSRPSRNRQGDQTSLGAVLLAERWSRETVRITEACTACGACLATCPERALRRAPKRPLVVDDACTACWECVEICPAGAIVAVDPGTLSPVLQAGPA